MKKLFFVFVICISNYQIKSQNVNSFTGAFNYNFPLFNLPSNRGTGTNIEANYNSGIQVNQPAGEIGLGWNINTGGAIYRSVSGIPDDAKNFQVPTTNTILVTYGQGALYNQYISYYSTVYDICKTQKGLDTAEFCVPDFDSYTMTSPSLNGQLKLSYYKFYPFSNLSPTSNGAYDYIPDQPLMNSGGLLYRKPQFHFSGDFADTLISRHYPDTINSSTPFNIPTTAISGLGYTSSREPFIGKHLNGTTISNQNFSTDSGRIASTNFIEYFRNGQIDSGQVLNFINYESGHSRSSTNFPVEGIGYFRVTGSDGLTYHYSLPVYQTENTLYRTPLDNDYTNNSGLTETDFGNPSDPDGKTPYQSALAPDVIIKNKDENMYAIKWLLTAITGPDFVDNGTTAGVIDDQDEGYWVSYDYELWNGSYIQRTPRFGYDYQYSPDAVTEEYPLYFPMLPIGSGKPYKTASWFGVANVRKIQNYYLSKIRTSSHTAVFVRDIRKDEKGDDEEVKITSSYIPSPELLLKRVILFKNEQLDSILGVYPTIAFNPTSYTQFDFTGTTNSSFNNFFTEDWYSTVSSSVAYCILKHVFFDQDYSLCKKYHGNVEVSYLNSSVLTSPTTVQSNRLVNTNSSSGKLTLNRILTYDFANQKLTPSTLFDYDANNILSPQSNPDYNTLKSDYWGFYKSDATTNSYSRYTNTYSKDYTKAWSLLKITDPLGGITQMEYESNSYNKVLDNQSPNGIRGAAFIYRIKSLYEINGLNLTGYGFGGAMEESNTSANVVNEFYYLNQTSCSKRICMPYFQNVCTGSSGCLYPLNTFFKGFEFADCNLNIDNSSNTVYGNMTAIAAVGHSGVLVSSTPPSSRYYMSNGSAGNLGLQPDQQAITGYAGPAYSGNGFILFETAIGYDVYGGGIRVKHIKHTNGANETYTKEYTYTDGVATNEMDRFEYPRLKRYINASICPVRYSFLEPKTFERFEMLPSIGYTKVTVKNLGQINADNGKVEKTFITDPNTVPFALRKNHSIATYATSYPYLSTYSVNTINECTNVFPSVFGSLLETAFYDKNGNMLTRSVNEYTTTQQGALTELSYFENHFFYLDWPVASTFYSGSYPMISNTVTIIRDIPVILKSKTTYAMGTFKKTQSVLRDEWTGESTAIQSSGQNNSSSISFRYPAYKFYHPIESVDFTSAKSRKIITLSRDIYNYSNIDSTLATNSFLTATYKLHSKTINQRQYSSGVYVTNQVTLPNYMNNRSFIFDAGQGSMNDYGMLDKSNLYSNPLSITTINSSLFWEPTSTYNWKLIYEATLLDDHKNLVETRDANNRFNADRYGYNGYYKIASATNSNYSSFTFANFENPAPSGSTNGTMDGDVYSSSINLVNYSTLLPHTGSKCIQVSSTPATFQSGTIQSPGGTMEVGLQTGRTYRASVWANTTNLSNAVMEITVAGMVNVAVPYSLSNFYSVNSTNNLVTTIGNWNLLQIDFTVPDKFTTGLTGQFKIDLKSVNGTAVYFDDFIFHPVESEFSANVYNPRNGRLMSTLDGNGLATNYFYDATGRTTEMWKEVPSVGYKKVKRYTYNYARGAAN